MRECTGRVVTKHSSYALGQRRSTRSGGGSGASVIAASGREFSHAALVRAFSGRAGTSTLFRWIKQAVERGVGIVAKADTPASPGEAGVDPLSVAPRFPRPGGGAQAIAQGRGNTEVAFVLNDLRHVRAACRPVIATSRGREQRGHHEAQLAGWRNTAAAPDQSGGQRRPMAVSRYAIERFLKARLQCPVRRALRRSAVRVPVAPWSGGFGLPERQGRPFGSG